MPSINLDPNGQAALVTLTSVAGVADTTVYLDAANTQPLTLPAVINRAVTWWVPSGGYSVSMRVQGIEVASPSGPAVVELASTDNVSVKAITVQVPSQRLIPRLGSRFNVFGHSYAGGGGTNSPDTGFVNRLAGAWGTNPHNVAVGGAILHYDNVPAAPSGTGGWVTVMQDPCLFPPDLIAPYVPVTGLSLLLYGVNDLGYTNNQLGWLQAVRACTVRAQAGVIFEDSPAGTYAGSTAAAIAYGGTWAAQTAKNTNSGTGWQKCVTNASTVTMTLPSDYPAGLDFWVQGIGLPGGAGVLTYTLDGVTVPAYATWAAYQAAVTAGTITPTALAVIGPTDFTPAKTGATEFRNVPVLHHFVGAAVTAGAHTLVGTVSAANATGFGFDCWGLLASPAPVALWPGLNKIPSYNFYNPTLSGCTVTGSAVVAPSALFIPSDVGKAIQEGGPGAIITTHIKAGTTIATVTDATHATLSQADQADGTFTAYLSARSFATDGGVDAWNAALQSTLGEFPSATYVPVDVLAKTAGWFYSDGLHPNEIGHAKFAAAIADTVSGLPLSTEQIMYQSRSRRGVERHTAPVYFTDGSNLIPITQTAGNVGSTHPVAPTASGATIQRTVLAAPGDDLEINVNGMWVNDGGTISGFIDFATIVSGAPVNWASTGNGTANAYGIPGFGAWNPTLKEPLSGSWIFTVQQADIVTGIVTLQLYGWLTAAGTRNVYGWAGNLALGVTVKNLSQPPSPNN